MFRSVAQASLQLVTLLHPHPPTPLPPRHVVGLEVGALHLLYLFVIILLLVLLVVGGGVGDCVCKSQDHFQEVAVFPHVGPEAQKEVVSLVQQELLPTEPSHRLIALAENLGSAPNHTMSHNCLIPRDPIPLLISKGSCMYVHVHAVRHTQTHKINNLQKEMQN